MPDSVNQSIISLMSNSQFLVPPFLLEQLYRLVSEALFSALEFPCDGDSLYEWPILCINSLPVLDQIVMYPAMS